MNNELVTLNETDNTITTTSRIVAETYGKDHKNVLRSIGKIIKDMDGLEEQDGSLPTQLRFEPSEYKDESGRSNKMYLLDRNAWTMLVMGYNGLEATRFKLKYIAAFDAMEAQLRKIAERQLIDANETIQALESQRDLLESSMKRTFTLTQAAKEIGLGVVTMNRELKKRGYFINFEYNDNEPVEILQECHLFIVRGDYKSPAMNHQHRQTYVTWEGLKWIRRILEDVLLDKGIIELADTIHAGDF